MRDGRAQRDAKHCFASPERAAIEGSPGPSAKSPPRDRTSATPFPSKQCIARHEALLPKSRTGCHRRQPWAISEATTPRQDVRNTLPFEAMHSATRSTASWGTSCTPPFGRPLRGRAPPLLLRCREFRTGCHRRQPWAISEATTPRQDVRNTLRPEATHSAKRSEPPQGYIRTGCTAGACAGNSVWTSPAKTAKRFSRLLALGWVLKNSGGLDPACLPIFSHKLTAASGS